MKNYIKDYPRPQMIRDNWINLNGPWNFVFDDEDRGEMDRFYEKELPEPLQIKVPFTYETEMSGIHETRFHKIIWYQRQLEAVKNEGMRVLLHFEGSDYRTKVWVNGVYIGQHKGGYERFSFDITETLSDTETDIITVRVEDSDNLSQPRGKQRWKKENYACWYVQTTGIWKTVWVEKVPNARIEDLKITPDIRTAEAKIEIGLTGAAGDDKAACSDRSSTAEANAGICSVRAIISYDGEPVSETTVAVRKESGRVNLTAGVQENSASLWESRGFRLWSPEDPALYDLTVQLLMDGEAVDTVRSYFGMREVRIDGGHILLNGEPIYQRLILDQGYWPASGLTPPDEDALIDDIDKIHAMGFNGLRKHMKIEDERFLYWCDRKGMLVWSEMPATYVFTADAVQNFTEEWLAIVRQNYSHPCIITWTPFNESWGVPDIRTGEEQQAFTKGIYYLTKSMDLMRPVITNDGWEHTVSDIITLHDYEEDGDTFRARYADKDMITSGEVYHNNFRCAMADGCKYKGQPIIISEYGGIAFSSKQDGEWGYGNAVTSEEAFLARYRKITDAIRAIPYICGYCYTQVSDVEQEVNGLLTAGRDFKIAPEKIAAVNGNNV